MRWVGRTGWPEPLRRLAGDSSPAIVIALFGFDLALPYSPWRHAGGVILADKLLLLSALVKVVEPLRIISLIRSKSPFNVPVGPVVAGMVSYESWTSYGLWNHNPVIFIPQAAGMLLAAAQLVLLIAYGAGPRWMHRPNTRRHLVRDANCHACRSVSRAFPKACPRDKCKGLVHVTHAISHNGARTDRMYLTGRCTACGTEAGGNYDTAGQVAQPLSQALFEAHVDAGHVIRTLWRTLASIYDTRADAQIDERRVTLEQEFVEGLRRTTIRHSELGGVMRVKRELSWHGPFRVAPMSLDEPQFTTLCQLEFGVGTIVVIGEGAEPNVGLGECAFGPGDWVWDVASLYVSLSMTAVRRIPFSVEPEIVSEPDEPTVLRYSAFRARMSVGAAQHALLVAAGEYAARRGDTAWRRRFWQATAVYYMAAAGRSIGADECTAAGMYAFGEAVVALQRGDTDPLKT